MNNIYRFKATDTNGKEIDMMEYKGKVLLIVNTATHCGYTYQYKELENLYQTFKGEEFEILDFPSNQFGEQAPETDEGINEFCSLNFNTTFKRFKKSNVNGEEALPLYKFLKEKAPKATEDEKSLALYKLLIDKLNFSTSGDEIKWNFTKFLISKEGHVIERFSPTVEPQELIERIRFYIDRE